MACCDEANMRAHPDTELPPATTARSRDGFGPTIFVSSISRRNWPVSSFSWCHALSQWRWATSSGMSDMVTRAAISQRASSSVMTPSTAWLAISDASTSTRSWAASTADGYQLRAVVVLIPSMRAANPRFPRQRQKPGLQGRLDGCRGVFVPGAEGKGQADQAIPWAAISASR